MTRASWEPGDVVVWRETWHGRTYFGWPVRGVEDSPERIVVYVAEGTPTGWEDWERDPSWPVPELREGWDR